MLKCDSLLAKSIKPIEKEKKKYVNEGSANPTARYVLCLPATYRQVPL